MSPTWKRDKAEQIEKELEEIETKKARRRRQIESGTSTGLRDYVFNAPALVEDLVTQLQDECDGLRQILEVLEDASVTLKDESRWTRLAEINFERVHRNDNVVFTTWLTTFEVTWKQTMTAPQKGKQCVFLHVGTETPSRRLMLVLNKLGWYGVSIAPELPETGFEDSVTGIVLDPSDEANEDAFTAIGELGHPYRGGLVPKPNYFGLAFCNFVYTVQELRDEMFGPGVDDRKMGTAVGPQDPSSYGLIGVSRSEGVAKRLRTIRTVLATALARLANKGTLIITWPGLPFHPAMLFITSYLRGLFERVHVNMQDGVQTFECYIICAEFRRDPPAPEAGAKAASKAKAPDNTFALRSFVNSAFRRNGLDDVLMWTLTENDLIREATYGMSGISPAKGYDDMWKLFAAKLRSFAFELGTVLDLPTKSKGGGRGAKGGGRGAKGDGKGDQGAQAKGKAKAAPKAKGGDKAKAKGKAKVGAKRQGQDDDDGKDDRSGKSDSDDEAPAAASGGSSADEAGVGKSKSGKTAGASPKAAARGRRRRKPSKGDDDDEAPAAASGGGSADEAGGAAKAAPGRGRRKPGKSKGDDGGEEPVAGKTRRQGKSKGSGKLPPVPGASRPGSGDEGGDGGEGGGEVEDEEEEGEAGEEGGAEDGEELGNDHGDEDEGAESRRVSGASGMSRRMGEDAGDATRPAARPAKRRLAPSRSLPSLSCTLGAAPGSMRNGPDMRRFAERHPMLSYGLLVADNMSLADGIDEDVDHRSTRKLPPRHIAAMHKQLLRERW